MAYRSGLRGDPGIGSFLRKAVGGIASVAGLALPGPLGAVARGAGSLVRRAGPVAGAVGTIAAVRSVAMPGGALPSPMQFASRTARDVREFAASAITGEACPKGHHLNKSGYFTKAQGWIPPRSKCVRNRSRNAANGRALRRAVGRVQSFNSIVKRSRKSLKALASI